MNGHAGPKSLGEVGMICEDKTARYFLALSRGFGGDKIAGALTNQSHEIHDA